MSHKLMDELKKFDLIIKAERIDEISNLLDLDLDDDIHNNLIDELEEIQIVLEREYKRCKTREIGLTLVS